MGEHGYLVHNECRLLDIQQIIDKKKSDVLSNAFNTFSDNLMSVSGLTKKRRGAFTQKIMDLGDDDKVVDYIRDFTNASESDLLSFIDDLKLVNVWDKLRQAGVTDLGSKIDEIKSIANKYLDDFPNTNIADKIADAGSYSKWYNTKVLRSADDLINILKVGDKKDIDYRFLEGLENLSGKIDIGSYTETTLRIEISAIAKNINYRGSVFKNLTDKAEAIARKIGLDDIEIEFQFVVNPRLKTDHNWAEEFGYFFSSQTDPNGIVSVTWSKFLE